MSRETARPAEAPLGVRAAFSFGLIGAGLLGILAAWRVSLIWLPEAAPPNYASLLLAVLSWALVAGILVRFMEAEGALGVATGVTLFRAWLVSLLAGLVLVPSELTWAFLPALIYLTVACLDHLDGRLARRFNQVSPLGAKLDMEVDALGILVATVLAIQLGKLPLWYLSLGLARYAFVFGLSYRRYRGRQTEQLPPSELRRWLAGFQMGFLVACLLPFVSREATLAAAWVFGGVSLLVFLRDWWFVTGRLHIDSPNYRRLDEGQTAVMPWVLVAVRLAIGLSFLLVMLRGPWIWPAWVSWLSVVAFVLTQVGWGARLGVFWLLGLFAIYAPYLFTMGLVDPVRVTVMGSCVVLLFGAGPLPFHRLIASLDPGAREDDPLRATS